MSSESYLAAASGVSTSCGPHWMVPPPRWDSRPPTGGTVAGPSNTLIVNTSDTMQNWSFSIIIQMLDMMWFVIYFFRIPSKPKEVIFPYCIMCLRCEETVGLSQAWQQQTAWQSYYHTTIGGYKQPCSQDGQFISVYLRQKITSSIFIIIQCFYSILFQSKLS